MTYVSPYGPDILEWPRITEELVSQHPLKKEDFVSAVLTSWESIFESRIGKHGIRIGKDIQPIPQIMGTFLHELIPLELAARYPLKWRREKTTQDKDLVCMDNDSFSVEIKTSSDKSNIFGNRSYAQPPSELGVKKSKNGYYLTVNFEKWGDCPENQQPRIRLIKFGWLDHTDWKAQISATGQQASLKKESKTHKLLELYRME